MTTASTFSTTDAYTMGGPTSVNEIWQLVPVVAERKDAHTDNNWYNLGEDRWISTQTVLIGFEEEVYYQAAPDQGTTQQPTSPGSSPSPSPGGTVTTNPNQGS